MIELVTQSLKVRIAIRSIMSDNIQVSKEFLEEEKQQLGQTMPKSKRGGPYPTHAKKSRRDEVFKLHFDHGYSARKISEMMKMNRNTVNSDIMYWYSQLQKQEGKIETADLINKTFYRLESRRTRLMEKLDKTTTLSDALLLERMILEIDNKIMQISIKIQTTHQSVYDITMKMFNNWLEENGYKERYVLWGQTLKVSSDSSDKIKQIIQTDKYQKS
jgi:predicted DNA-binding protein YlxM (UPF0122 family)